jgi:enoyl-CoA hydratase/carnithine racemase
MSHESNGNDVVLFEMIDAHVALVSLNRPDKRNAVSVAVAQAFGRIVTDTESRSEIRAVVLASTDPRCFCAGADLADVAAGRASQLIGAGGFAGFVDAPRRKPWIAAVDGPALAGGCELCLACDMIIAGDTASFGVPEVKRGLIAGAGGCHRLPKLIPRNIAMEIIATGEPVSAARAHHLGLVNHLVPAGSARQRAIQLAQAIAANAPVAVQESLHVAREAVGRDDVSARAVARASFAVILATEDVKEGPRAFLEKRPPVWQGH